MNSNNPEQTRALSDDIICCSDSQSDDFKLSDSGNLNQFANASSNPMMCSSAQSRRGLVHSVSIIVEPAINVDDCNFDDDLPITPAAPIERRKTIAGPIAALEDFYFGKQQSCL